MRTYSYFDHSMGMSSVGEAISVAEHARRDRDDAELAEDHRADVTAVLAALDITAEGLVLLDGYRR